MEISFVQSHGVLATELVSYQVGQDHAMDKMFHYFEVRLTGI